MISWKEALENPELMINHKDDIKDEKIFDFPWYKIFHKYPYLYREFSDRFDEMGGWDVSRALRSDPTLISDLKDYLHKMDGGAVGWVVREVPALVPDLKEYLHKPSKIIVDWLMRFRPELSLCMKYRDNPDKVEAACYVLFPHRLDDLNKEEKREMAKRIIELLKEEKV